MAGKDKKRKKVPDNDKRALQFLKEMKEGAIDSELRKKYQKIGQEVLKDDVPKTLDPRIRKEMKSIISADPGKVRIHTDEKAGVVSKMLGARAFAIGDQDIFFGEGEYNPSTTAGRALIAHELTHLSEKNTGFGRSAQSRPVLDEYERKATVSEEMLLAYEKRNEEEAEEAGTEPDHVKTEDLKTADSSELPDTAAVNKRELEDMVWDILDRQMRRDRERGGKY
jgi:hypothetical protein